MCGNVLHYSQHKYASNVIERCLREGAQQERHQLIEEVIGEHNADTLSKMMRDQVIVVLRKHKQNSVHLQFANYVIQRMFEVADDEYKTKMIGSIRPHIPNLKRYNYGKHIMSKLEKWLIKKGNVDSAMSRDIVEPNGPIMYEHQPMVPPAAPMQPVCC